MSFNVKEKCREYFEMAKFIGMVYMFLSLLYLIAKEIR